jgi:hypothetical protein
VIFVGFGQLALLEDRAELGEIPERVQVAQSLDEPADDGRIQLSEPAG